MRDKQWARSWRKHLGRVARRVLKIILLSLACLVVIMATVLLVAPLRSALLGWGVGLADGALPGQLTVARTAWPSLGNLVLEDVLWVEDMAGADGDTLADLALVDLEIDLKALGKRQGRIPSLQLKARRLDIPAITAAMGSRVPEPAIDPSDQDPSSGEIPFLVPGSLPGIPSLAVNRLDVTVDRIRLAPDFDIIDANLAGRVDTRPGKAASLVVDHAAAGFHGASGDTSGPPAWDARVGHLGLGLNLEVMATETGGWTLVTAGLDSLNLDLVSHDLWQLGETESVTEPVNLWASGRITQTTGSYTGQMDCDFVLPGSRYFRARLPEDFPHEEFGRVSGSLTAEGDFDDPGARVSLRLDLGSNTWLEKGLIIGEAQSDSFALGTGGLSGVTARLDTLDLAVTGISAVGSGHWSAGDGALALNLAVEYLQLPGLVLDRLNPGMRDLLADTQQMKMNADAGVRMKGDQYSGQVECRFDLPGSALFRNHLPDDFPHGRFETLVGEVSLAGDYAAPQASGTLNLDLSSNTWLDEFLVAGWAEGDLDKLKESGFGDIAARLDTLAFAMDGLTLAGSGNWKDEGGDVGLNLQALDFRIPGLVLDRLEPELRAAWADTDEVDLEAAAALRLSGAQYTGQLECRFNLPGSDHFGPWLPEDFPHEEFPTLAGDIAVSGSFDAPSAQGTVRLDLGANPWLDQGLISGSATADVPALKAGDFRDLVARIDTLEVDGLGLKISAEGFLEPGKLDLKLESEVTDFSLPLLFVAPKYANADLDLRLQTVVGGSLENPTVDARLGGRILEGSLVVPEFDFHLKGDRENVTARVHAGGGLRYQTTYLDSLDAEVGGELAALDTLLVNYDLAVWSRKGSLAVGGSARGDSLRVVTLDSLIVKGFGEDMSLRQPVSLTLGQGRGEVVLTPLDFAGNAGSITAAGFHNEQSMDLEAKLDLLLQEDLLQLVAPSPLWSLKGGVDMKLEAAAHLEGHRLDPAVVGRVGALLLPHRKEPPFGMELSFTSRGGEQANLDADFFLTSADTVLLEASLDWPGKAGTNLGFWNPDPEKDLVLTVPNQQLDLAKINRRLPEEVVLTGRFDLGGEVHVFPPGKQEAVPDSLALIPLRGNIEGSLSTPDLRIDLPNRSWLKTTVDASVQGQLADPLVKAKVVIKDGFIRIPEIPRNLHPTEGPSLLWALNDSLLAAADTTEGGTSGADGTGPPVLFRPAENVGPALDPLGPALLPDMDLELAITNDLRIIGYGADLKLLGNVAVKRGFDEDNYPGPALSGDVRVHEGNLKVMNRVFVIERGNIKFTGGVPANPHLDLMLESQVNAYLVRILVSGRAADPVIELTSEPDLSEEDIMAVLLFGQPMNDLDNDQRGRMQEENDPSRELQKNLAGLAMAFGTKGLQDSMSETFGVDMVQMGSDSEGGSTLEVGKFITPDIMIKYNQSLEKSGTYFMTLEYTLTRYFKVMTTYGQGDEDSGAQLQWSRRY